MIPRSEAKLTAKFDKISNKTISTKSQGKKKQN